MDVQTRGGEHGGEIQIWPTIAVAFAEAKKDRTIWKISWTNEETGERVRLERTPSLTHRGGKGKLIKSDDVWVYSPINLPLIDRRDWRTDDLPVAEN